MKFLNEKGKIVEGLPLTDEQIIQRERLISYFHENCCHNYHGVYGERGCEQMATDYVTGKLIEVANAQPEPEPAPLLIEVVEPIIADIQLPTPEPPPAGSIAAIAPGIATA